MAISFIRNIEMVKGQLDDLYHRAKKEESHFTNKILCSKEFIDQVYDIYYEVLQRDNTQDEPTPPKLRSIQYEDDPTTL